MNQVNSYLAQLADYARQTRDIAEQQRIERARDMERFRGIKDITYRIPPFPAATSLTIQGTSLPVDQGFALNLKMITGKLSAADTVVAYLGESNIAPVIGAVAGVGAGSDIVFWLTWSSDQKMLNAGESIFLKTAAAGNLSDVTIFGIQIPAEQKGKILS